MNVRFSREDIPHDVAYNAHRGSSFSPGKRAQQEQDGYFHYIAGVVERFSVFNTDENQNSAELEADLQRFVDGYKKRKLDLLHSEAGHVSSMIAGPANFPARRMNKIADRINSKMRDLVDYADKAIRAMERKHDPRVFDSRPVNVGAQDAGTRLREKLDKAVSLQELMKKANRICRSKKKTDTEKIAALIALDGIGEESAGLLLNPTQSYESPGFPSYKLSNNNATIRRLKARIADVESLQQAEPMSVYWEYFSATEDAADNRIRLEFMGKPNKEIRDWLNGHAWHWSRLNEAWQRKVTENARRNARAFVEEFKDALQSGDYLEA